MGPADGTNFQPWKIRRLKVQVGLSLFQAILFGVCSETKLDLLSFLGFAHLCSKGSQKDSAILLFFSKTSRQFPGMPGALVY